MQSLIELLRHPYIILNHVASWIYKSDKVADYERLRSRARERHRFTEAEVKALHRFFKGLARKTRQRAERIEALLADMPAHTRVNLKAQLEIHEVNLKAILKEVGAPADKSYYQLYDQLRERTLPSREELERLATAYRAYSEYIEDQLTLTRKEAHTYRFNYGKGSASHLENS